MHRSILRLADDILCNSSSSYANVYCLFRNETHRLHNIWAESGQTKVFLPLHTQLIYSHQRKYTLQALTAIRPLMFSALWKLYEKTGFSITSKQWCADGLFYFLLRFSDKLQKTSGVFLTFLSLFDVWTRRSPRYPLNVFFGGICSAFCHCRSDSVNREMLQPVLFWWLVLLPSVLFSEDQPSNMRQKKMLHEEKILTSICHWLRNQNTHTLLTLAWKSDI